MSFTTYYYNFYFWKGLFCYQWIKEQIFSGDKAYIGKSQITTPHKKPKKGKLTENQIEENKALSSNRT
ncbi:MAG: transposase family protein [Crocosphaera sp.]